MGGQCPLVSRIDRQDPATLSNRQKLPPVKELNFLREGASRGGRTAQS